MLGPFGGKQVSWFLTTLWRGDTSNSRGFLIWPEDPAFGFSAQGWVRCLSGSGPWFVRLGCYGEEGDNYNHGVLMFSLESATVDLLYV